jgi:hypothetical protein
LHVSQKSTVKVKKWCIIQSLFCEFYIKILSHQPNREYIAIWFLF